MSPIVRGRDTNREREGAGFGLAENVKRVRTARGLSHNRLSNMAGVSQGFISDLETGKSTNPGAYLLYRIALALRVTMEDLMGVSPLNSRTRINQSPESKKRLRDSLEQADTMADDHATPGDSGP